MQKKLALYTLLGLAPILAVSTPNSAHASTTWHSFCSNISANQITQNTNTMSATNYIVQASDDPSVQMIAGQVIANQTGVKLTKDQFPKFTNITSTGMLALVLKHKMHSCDQQNYIDALTPILDTLNGNGQINITWNNVTLKSLKSSFKAKQIKAQISQSSNNVHVTISFSGLVNDRKQVLEAFFPTHGKLDFTTTSQAYALILAETSSNNNGRASTQTLPITINSLAMNNAITQITASGTGTLNGNVNLTSANGIVTVTNMDTLIAESGNIKNNNNIKTGLILAKFAGHSKGNDTLEWNINWKGTLLKVNHVSIPVW